MDDRSRHPDETILFDLVEGSLDAAGEAGARAHLAHCSACTAFVAAATAGKAALADAVEPMPGAAARSLQLRLGAEWRDRSRAIAADEKAADALDVAGPAPTPVDAPTTDAIDRDNRRSRWSRRLVPVLAFSVLATLAGTSIVVDDLQQRQPGPGGGGAQDGVVGGRAQPSTSEPAAPADATSRDERAEAGQQTQRATPAAAAEGAALPAPGDAALPAPADAALPPPTCVAGRAEDPPALPGGLLVRTIVQGPLGLVVVCG